MSTVLTVPATHLRMQETEQKFKRKPWETNRIKHGSTAVTFLSPIESVEPLAGNILADPRCSLEHLQRHSLGQTSSDAAMGE